MNSTVNRVTAGEVGVPGQGPFMTVVLVVGGDTVSSAKYRTYPCPAASACGQSDSMTDPDGGSTEYWFDTDNRIFEIIGSQVVNIERDALGRTINQADANDNLIVVNTYDPAGGKTTVTNESVFPSPTVLSVHTVTYDAASNVISRSDTVNTEGWSSPIQPPSPTKNSPELVTI